MGFSSQARRSMLGHFAAVACFLSCLVQGQGLNGVEHVIMVSVDGMRADYMREHGDYNFNWLRNNGACTLNARNDPRTCQTQPNHFNMFTAQLCQDHGKCQDGDDGSTLRGENIFDLVRDEIRGSTTAFYGGKEKFAQFRRSFELDRYLFDRDTDDLVETAVTEMRQKRWTLMFLHIRTPDQIGHQVKGADSRGYRNAVEKADELFGEVRALANEPYFRGKIAIVFTDDHGFADKGNHADCNAIENYRIAFCTWGPGVVVGGDLYELNECRRRGLKGIAASNDDTHPHRELAPRGCVVNPGNKKGQNLNVIRNSHMGSTAAEWLGLELNSGGTPNEILRFTNSQSPPKPPNNIAGGPGGDTFQIDDGTHVTCNWARKKPKNRCNRPLRNGGYVYEECPNLCANNLNPDPNDDEVFNCNQDGYFRLKNGKCTDCNWAEKEADERCPRALADGSLVERVCPDACD